MAIEVDQGFELKNKNALDVRTHFKTLQEMKDYDEAFLPDVFYAVNDETGKIYIFNKNNIADATLGKWQEVGASANVDTVSLVDYTNFWDNLEITSAGYVAPTPDPNPDPAP